MKKKLETTGLVAEQITALSYLCLLRNRSHYMGLSPSQESVPCMASPILSSAIIGMGCEWNNTCEVAFEHLEYFFKKHDIAVITFGQDFTDYPQRFVRESTFHWKCSTVKEATDFNPSTRITTISN